MEISRIKGRNGLSEITNGGILVHAVAPWTVPSAPPSYKKFGNSAWSSG